MYIVGTVHELWTDGWLKIYNAISKYLADLHGYIILRNSFTSVPIYFGKQLSDSCNDFWQSHMELLF